MPMLAAAIPAVTAALPSLSTVATVIAAGSTIAQMAGNVQAGNSARAYGDYQARVARTQATNDMAAGQARAGQEREATAYAISHAQAAAAASGGGATDTTVANVENQIEKQGTFNSLMAIFNGNSRAYGDTAQANADVYEGQQARRKDLFQAAGSLIGGGASLYQKYGWGAPAYG